LKRWEGEFSSSKRKEMKMAVRDGLGQGAPTTIFGRFIRRLRIKGIEFPQYIMNRPYWFTTPTGTLHLPPYINSNHPQLVTWKDQLGRTGTALPGTKEKFLAYCDAARQAGFEITFVSPGDTYRKLEGQTRGFFRRYVRGIVKGAKQIKTCSFEGKKQNYSLISGAPMACPGNSEHGGLAIDHAQIFTVFGRKIVRGLSTNYLKWAVSEAPKYGLCWRGSNVKLFENWHLENYEYNYTPVAVCAWIVKQNPEQYPVLKRGSSGPAVKKLQEYLNNHGARLIVDGEFGLKTEAALSSSEEKIIWGNGNDWIVALYEERN
jgi:hypothetical protein